MTTFSPWFLSLNSQVQTQGALYFTLNVSIALWRLGDASQSPSSVVLPQRYVFVSNITPICNIYPYACYIHKSFSWRIFIVRKSPVQETILPPRQPNILFLQIKKLHFSLSPEALCFFVILSAWLTTCFTLFACLSLWLSSTCFTLFACLSLWLRTCFTLFACLSLWLRSCFAIFSCLSIWLSTCFTLFACLSLWLRCCFTISACLSLWLRTCFTLFSCLFLWLRTCFTLFLFPFME